MLIANVDTCMDIDIKTLKCGTYNRKSSVSEDKQVQSIQTQERENIELAKRLGLRDIPESFYSETKSAFVPGREIFQQLVRDIEKGKINAVIAIHPSRLARNPIDAGQLIYLMDTGKLSAIITCSRTYYPTASDKFMLGLEFVISKKDSDDKSKGVKDGQKTKALKGVPHGVAAIGFLNDQMGEKGNKNWIVDPERFQLVEMIFKRFLEKDISGAKLHQWAVETLKLTTPKRKRIGGHLIVLSRIYVLLKDPIYAGFFYQNGVEYPLNPSLPRIITRDQHELIFKLLGSGRASKAKTHPATYTGFIKGTDGGFVGQDPKLQVICDCKEKFSLNNKVTCPHCNKDLNSLESPKYLTYNFYYNVGRKKQKLPTHYIEEKKINEYLINYIQENLEFSADLAGWSRKYLKELRDKEVENEMTVIDQQKHRKTEIESKRVRYRELLADGLITPDEYRQDMTRIEKLVSATDMKITHDWFSRANEIVDLTEELVGLLKNGTVEAKRRVLGRLGSNLTWDEKILNVYNTKAVQTLVDGLKEAKAKNAQFEPGNLSLDKGETEAFTSVRPSLLRG
jgi:site-specific DNA recombinase